LNSELYDYHLGRFLLTNECDRRILRVTHGRDARATLHYCR